MTRISAFLMLAAALVSGLGSGRAQDLPCGMKPGDWCQAAAGDPCGRHRNVRDCQADPRCYGVPYRGESVVACIVDERGFASNCPTVGCASTPPGRQRR